MTPQRHTWAVPAWLVAAFAVVSALALRGAVRTEGPGRFLYVVLGVATAVEALRGALLRPTLAADADGIEVAIGLRRRRLPWSDVHAVGAMGEPSTGPRLRRRANVLEIDLGSALLLVPRYRLDAPVAEVVSSLDTIRTSGS